MHMRLYQTGEDVAARRVYHLRTVAARRVYHLRTVAARKGRGIAQGGDLAVPEQEVLLLHAVRRDYHAIFDQDIIHSMGLPFLKQHRRGPAIGPLRFFIPIGRM